MRGRWAGPRDGGRGKRLTELEGTFAGYLHVMAAWAVENRLVFGQQSVPVGRYEIAIIPILLTSLDRTGVVATIDATGC